MKRKIEGKSTKQKGKKKYIFQDSLLGSLLNRHRSEYAPNN